MNDKLFKTLVEQKAKMLAWDALDENEKGRYLIIALEFLEDNYSNLAGGIAKVLKNIKK